MKKEIVITGFGGQGIVLAGRVLGNAAAIGDNTVDLDFDKGVILGTFVNREKPTFYEKYMKINGLE